MCQLGYVANVDAWVDRTAEIHWWQKSCVNMLDSQLQLALLNLHAVCTALVGTLLASCLALPEQRPRPKQPESHKEGIQKLTQKHQSG
jgi:hypothetical protein